MSYILTTSLPTNSPDFYIWGFCIGFNLAMIFAFVLKSVESVLITKLFGRGARDKSSALGLGDLGLEKKGLLKFLLRDNSSLRKVVSLVYDEADAEGENTSGGTDVALVCSEKSTDSMNTDSTSGESSSADTAANVNRANGESTCADATANVNRASGEGGDIDTKGEKGGKTKPQVDFDRARFYINEENEKRAKSLSKGATKWYLLPVFTAISIGLAIGIIYLIPIFQNW